MTEMKHGSNVAGLQTEAILDLHTDEWIINVGGRPAGRLPAAQRRWGLGLSSPLRSLLSPRIAAHPAALLQTPDDGAIKWWIGNAAEDGRMATVFARLKVGPHP
jgi:acyl-CoA oxidase